jgi:hypothetical protein
MGRDTEGVYTLPLPPVAPGQTIQSSWANTSFNDMAIALTGSLARDGSGGMAGPMKNVAGTANEPGSSWTAEPNSGLYYSGTGDVRFSILSTDNFRWRIGGADIWNGAAWDEVLTGTPGNTTVPEGTLDLQVLEWDQTTNQSWVVAPPLVKVPAGFADNQIIEWNETGQVWELGVQTGGDGPTIEPGLADGHMLYWEADTSAWSDTASIIVDSSGNIQVTGLVDTRDINADGIAQDAHIADANIHFTVGSINHTQLVASSIGTNNHAEIDTHIESAIIHFDDAPDTGLQYVRQSEGWSILGSADPTFWDEVGVDIVPSNNGIVKGTLSSFGNKNADSQIMTLTQAEYDATVISPGVDANTLYIVVP